LQLPESTGYRLKSRVLGPPLHSDDLAHERLGKPTALAVFASDNLSSSAYATEEILSHLIPYIGLAAFALVVPITIALLVVLGFLILSYRQTIKAYPSAGGAYIVTRDNFGLLPAQVAGVALLTDYILTVAVSVAAGTAALTSAAPFLRTYTVEIAVAFIIVIAYGNLRGVKESGKIFAAPTYFFIANMAVLLVVGLGRLAFGHLPGFDPHQPGLIEIGHRGNGFIMGAGLFVVMRAFASGGAAVTGVEAISNGVPAFRVPEWKNARSTLVVMGTLLGAMFLGLSVLGAHLRVIPFEGGSPTVISLIGKLTYGASPIGHVLYLCLQAGTMLILVLAANTSFADFPRLASFHAGDNFMPRQLTKRGHRLVFSNGIISLAVTSVVLVIVTGARVDKLIPLYAIGVFTSFTLSQGGMAKHHWTKREPGWKGGLFINGTGAVLSLVVDVIIAITKFKPKGQFLGAWFIILLVPVLVLLLVRLNRQYEAEAQELEEDAPKAAAAPVMRRHQVLVLVDALDLAAARAIQYARTLHPDDLRAIHFDLDPVITEDLQSAWARLGFSRLPLDILECPDRRLAAAAASVVAEGLADGETEVSVLIPRRQYSRAWHRLLHDRSGDAIVEAVSLLPHANATIVPYQLDRRAPADQIGAAGGQQSNDVASGAQRRAATTMAIPVGVDLGPDVTPAAEVAYRQRLTAGGRITGLRVQPFGGNPSLEVTLSDASGRFTLVFPGRRSIPGLTLGATITASGMVGNHKGRLAMLNPTYEILAAATPVPSTRVLEAIAVGIRLLLPPKPRG